MIVGVFGLKKKERNELWGLKNPNLDFSMI
jgi:hypothetical protein